MIKDTYKGNAESKLLEIKDMISNIEKSIDKKQMTEAILIERLSYLKKDLEEVIFLLSLC
jgi:hypothetical protein